MRLKHDLELALRDELRSEFEDVDWVFLGIPKHREHGDFALAVFSLSKIKRQAPNVIAEGLAERLNASALSDEIVFSAVSGYVNLTLTDAALLKRFSVFNLSGALFPDETKRNVLLEYVSANPTGPLHIGHGRWAVLGDVISRLLAYIGCDVSREFYINDAGVQIRLFRESVLAVKEGREVPENGYRGPYIQEISEKDGDAVELTLADQKQVLSGIRVDFDQWFSELTIHEAGLVDEGISVLREKGFVFDEAGAVWFRSTEFGDDKDRVLVKADGNYTYFAVDIAYHYEKIKRGFDQLIDIWGADHHGYIGRVKGAVSALLGEAVSEDSFLIVIGQLVSLYRDGAPVRMSKRTGDMITLAEVAEEIGVDALRYYLLEKGADTHLEFDLAVAARQASENPVFYVQYGHARICRLLEKAEAEGVAIPGSIGGYALESSERQLLVSVLGICDEVYSSALGMQPHRVVQSVYHLAQLFHGFYSHCPILKLEDVALRGNRLFIAFKVRETICFVLEELLGISAPVRM